MCVSSPDPASVQGRPPEVGSPPALDRFSNSNPLATYSLFVPVRCWLVKAFSLRYLPCMGDQLCRVF